MSNLSKPVAIVPLRLCGAPRNLATPPLLFRFSTPSLEPDPADDVGEIPWCPPT